MHILICEFIRSVEYKSSLIGEHIFDVQCQIENLSKPLNIFITVEVMELLSKLVYIDDDNKGIEMIENCDNVINVGQVRCFKTIIENSLISNYPLSFKIQLFLREPKKIKFEIINNGQLDFDYSWILKTPHYDRCEITLSEDSGTVERNSISTSYLEIILSEKINNCNYSVIFHVSLFQWL